MKIDEQDFIKYFMEKISNMDYMRSDDIPNIDLYMDQVTTFMDEHLGNSKRFEKDKVLTKTMINNYAKNHLLPPPEKKKYSREHMMILIFIYYFKGFLSFSDIQNILNPLTDRYFHSEKEVSLKWIYDRIFELGQNELSSLNEDIRRIIQRSAGAFPDAPEEDTDFLQMFAMICLLSFDVYAKKQLIEQIVDAYTHKDE